jgi:hypothetical protein
MNIKTRPQSEKKIKRKKKKTYNDALVYEKFISRNIMKNIKSLTRSQ